jgi:hypothetical protein
MSGFRFIGVDSYQPGWLTGGRSDVTPLPRGRAGQSRGVNGSRTRPARRASSRAAPGSRGHELAGPPPARRPWLRYAGREGSRRARPVRTWSRQARAKPPGAITRSHRAVSEITWYIWGTPRGVQRGVARVQFHTAPGDVDAQDTFQDEVRLPLDFFGSCGTFTRWPDKMVLHWRFWQKLRTHIKMPVSIFAVLRLITFGSLQTGSPMSSATMLKLTTLK